jgi:peptidyl-prolyl cis-trans isomerase C
LVAPRWLAGVLRSRLFHFAVLGGAIFAAAPRRQDPRTVEVSGAGLAAVERAQAARDGAGGLSADKKHEVDARTIEDEILYREGVRLGLDRGDPIVRQRVIQKLLLLVEDLGGASRPPTEAELQAFFDGDPTRWRLPPSYHFIHVFASRADALPQAASLAASGVPTGGEPFPYSREVTGSRQDIARLYGPSFADAVADLVPGASFSEPLASSFGWHRVRLVERQPGRVPRFEEVRRSIELDYAMSLRERVVGAYLKKTASEYSITVDGRALTGFVPTRRVAVRSDPSAED